MSTEVLACIGALYLQKSSNKHNKQDVVIKRNYSGLLKPFQIDGLRFLYKKYLERSGAVLNDEDSLGKTVQTVLFLSAIHSNTTKQSLILCDENKRRHWLYHFFKWTNIKASLSHQENSAKDVVIAPPTECNLVSDKKWNVIVIDNLEPIVYSKQIQNSSCAFKIWLADRNIKDDVKKVYKVLHWITSNKIGTQKKFESSLVYNDLPILEAWKNRQLLNLLYNNWILRRAADDIQDQLPIVDNKVFRVEFQNWMKSHDSYGNNSIDNVNILSPNGDTILENSENETFTQSSPSLLDLTTKSDEDKTPNKRKKGKDDTLLKVKRIKSNASNEGPNTSIISDIAPSQSPRRESEAGVNVSLPSDTIIKTEVKMSENEYINLEHTTNMNDINSQTEKIEDDDNDHKKIPPKLDLLNSLFSIKRKVRKLVESDEDKPIVKHEQVDDKFKLCDETTTSSEKKSFRYLERFFS